MLWHFLNHGCDVVLAMLQSRLKQAYILDLYSWAIWVTFKNQWMYDGSQKSQIAPLMDWIEWIQSDVKQAPTHLNKTLQTINMEQYHHTLSCSLSLTSSFSLSHTQTLVVRGSAVCSPAPTHNW
jgi:hypothetical protein